jgi:hypothetical protein
LRNVAVTHADPELFGEDGFKTPGEWPAHAIYSERIDVSVYPVESVGSNAAGGVIKEVVSASVSCQSQRTETGSRAEPESGDRSITESLPAVSPALKKNAYISDKASWLCLITPPTPFPSKPHSGQVCAHVGNQGHSLAFVGRLASGAR